MSLVLGVDGGNSKAIALLAEPDGTVVASARRLGAADIYAAGGEASALELTRGVVDDALNRAGAAPEEVDWAVFSMAGADWPEDFALLRGALAEVPFSEPPIVVNDAIGALSGAVPEGPAVVVSLGTGAATGARGRDGRTWHSSFWQSPQGAGELAQRALAAVVRAELGIAPATLIAGRLLEATSQPSVEALLHRFTARDGTGNALIAPMARALLDAARIGDEAARQAVERHGTGIGELAAAAARRVGIDREPYALAFCGGLARASGAALIEAAVAAVRAAGQVPSRVEPRWQPAVGALVIGLRKFDRVPWPAIAERLDATAPPDVLYDVLAG